MIMMVMATIGVIQLQTMLKLMLAYILRAILMVLVL